jgi:protein-L-isoaspartate(D-aspartate) O-methyltransferase
MRMRALWTAAAAVIAACAPGQAERSSMTDAAAGQPTQNDAHAARRARMVSSQLRSRDITHTGVLDAMGRVPRHRFVPAGLESQAYEDNPLPIGDGQTISQPYIVAYMTQVLEPSKTDRVLEIGTGSGYQAAVLAELVKEVFTIEIVPSLSERSTALLASLGYTNVRTRQGDGYAGWPEAAPFDKIIVTAAPEAIPQTLVDQLAVGGLMAVPVGRDFQTLTVLRRTTDGVVKRETMAVRFVPMIKKGG